ncbi:GTPase HflX [Bradyrhizobium japonicum]|jgi:GTP-binding protein HflX|uniref:GTPase HflX n=1 Tax=Bradyrhizobium TaxID=374 RepID=UPI000AB9FD3E|nr:GTPase HflX [Bradyrhizobium japonicum]MBR0764973.1 GTPase HflX [Bradyrhizobium japonicum]MCS3537731.1 GTP-binding protein HflX [Bradyrhizobium japonicum]MCS3986183.1 GTP-binding protein HflX [Bradyrhizobium japonicum]MCS4019002.1 GTP-binding protein HflX [Bradyrhizobium japonicum]MCS4206110.1 GTP-binding protein HflX [Bradyrhizobium japonicum]
MAKTGDSLSAEERRITRTVSHVAGAILVGVQTPGVDDDAHAASLAELGRLVNTLGYEVVGTISQKRDELDGATVLGKGRIEELAAITGGSGVVGPAAHVRQSKARERFEDADRRKPNAGQIEPDPESPPKPAFVIVDHDISPNQARNIERATGAQVLDRTGVIVEIFHRHAHSREAKLQVEMARLKYIAPRLRESWSAGERRQGYGAGESDLELERRKIRDRIAELKEQLEAIRRDSDHRRDARRDQPRVALVGYTNAGKSSLMQALTDGEVLVADKLFATLDTTVRALQPETKPRILVSDTVGFIKKLPHDLVVSFRSTLAEALEASLLLFVVDASDPTYESQLEVTHNVLREIGAEIVPSRLLLNKIDRVSEADRTTLRAKHPDAILLSARSPADLAALRETITTFFEVAMVEEEFVVPYAKQGMLSDVYQHAHVLSETYDATGRIIKVRGFPGVIARLRRTLSLS